MSNHKLISFILYRYLRFDKTQPFISVTAILAFLGVGVGVMVLLVTMGIMNGMIQEFERKLFIMNYPITIFSTSNRGLKEDLLIFLERKFPNMQFSPYIQTQAIVREGNEIYPLVVYGIDLERERMANQVIQSSQATSFSDTFSVLLGENLYHALNIQSGEKATFIFTDLAPTGLALTPKIKKFIVDATFSSGLKNYDNSIAYTSFEALRLIRGIKDNIYDGFHIYSQDSMQDIVLINQALKEYESMSGVALYAEAQGWWEQNGNFFSAMELEKKSLFLVLMLIILMASLNIISSLLMVVMNRRKEIALLISLGASNKDIKKLFFRLGVVIGGSGILFGVIMAFVVMWILKTFPIISLPVDVYGVSRLPIELLMSDFIGTMIGALFIVCLSSYYPAMKASKIDVLQVLRNE
ncbi:ABC transporter permease [Helicobacter muridarum]|uniref:ABC transporter permease n=1 Tax=Helicobacter muridarum TaxID=216 RepID=A0A099U084_9HELI|nr:ABC transporter permease [Helicobacter muridarum]TLE00004.1 ABC transporter permease [Helicobacter muridarum]STQ87077.1 Lipoprotein release system protein [Helicobacter muridarum]